MKGPVAVFFPFVLLISVSSYSAWSLSLPNRQWLQSFNQPHDEQHKKSAMSSDVSNERRNVKKKVSSSFRDLLHRLNSGYAENEGRLRENAKEEEAQNITGDRHLTAHDLKRIRDLFRNRQDGSGSDWETCFPSDKECPESDEKDGEYTSLDCTEATKDEKESRENTSNAFDLFSLVLDTFVLFIIAMQTMSLYVVGPTAIALQCFGGLSELLLHSDSILRAIESGSRRAPLITDIREQLELLVKEVSELLFRVYELYTSDWNIPVLRHWLQTVFSVRLLWMIILAITISVLDTFLHFRTLASDFVTTLPRIISDSQTGITKMYCLLTQFASRLRSSCICPDISNACSISLVRQRIADAWTRLKTSCWEQVSQFMRVYFTRVGRRVPEDVRSVQEYSRRSSSTKRRKAEKTVRPSAEPSSSGDASTPQQRLSRSDSKLRKATSAKALSKAGRTTSSSGKTPQAVDIDKDTVATKKLRTERRKNPSRVKPAHNSLHSSVIEDRKVSRVSKRATANITRK